MADPTARVPLPAREASEAPEATRALEARDDFPSPELAGRGRFILPPPIFVLELKYNERIPLWLCSALNSLNVQPDRVSKYCHAMDWVAYRGTVLASPTA